MIGILRHFGRLGGVLVAPRTTLRRMLWHGEGRLWEIIPWMIAVTAAVAPTQAGRALLVGRVAIVDGLKLFLNLVATRMLAPLLGLIVAASILHLIDRLRRPGETKVGFDVALDAVAYTLVPFFMLAAVGVVLHGLGIELWFLPHRPLRAPGWYGVARIATAFGWSILLFLFLVRDVWQRSGEAREAETRSESSGSSGSEC